MASGILLQRIDAALVLVRDELIRASNKFGPFMSAHEGFAVLLEEVDELWDDVKKNNPTGAATEAIQVAAMATRFFVDLRPAVN